MGTCLRGRLCAHKQVPTALLTPTRWNLKLSYKQHRSFTITNTSPSRTVTCKWCTGGWQAATLPTDHRATSCAELLQSSQHSDSVYPVLKNNSWPISNIAQAQGQCNNPHFDISFSSSPKALVLTVHSQRSWTGLGGCPKNLLLLQAFTLVPPPGLSRQLWNAHQKPEQMFCKINLSTYQQNVNMYKRLVSFDGLSMKAQHYSNTRQWKMHKVVKQHWYQESTGDSVQPFWMLSHGCTSLSLAEQRVLNHLSAKTEPFPKLAPPGTHQEFLNTQYNQNTICSLRNAEKWTGNPERPVFVVWSLVIIILKRKINK